MKIEQDPKADAIYIYLTDDSYEFGVNLDDERRIDYAANDTARGIELLSVSEGVNITGLPNAQEIGTLLENMGIRVYSEIYLTSGTVRGTTIFTFGQPTFVENIYADSNAESTQREAVPV